MENLQWTFGYQLPKNSRCDPSPPCGHPPPRARHSTITRIRRDTGNSGHQGNARDTPDPGKPRHPTYTGDTKHSRITAYTGYPKNTRNAEDTGHPRNARVSVLHWPKWLCLSHSAVFVGFSSRNTTHAYYWWYSRCPHGSGSVRDS